MRLSVSRVSAGRSKTRTIGPPFFPHRFLRQLTYSAPFRYTVPLHRAVPRTFAPVRFSCPRSYCLWTSVFLPRRDFSLDSRVYFTYLLTYCRSSVVRWKCPPPRTRIDSSTAPERRHCQRPQRRPSCWSNGHLHARNVVSRRDRGAATGLHQSAGAPEPQVLLRQLHGAPKPAACSTHLGGIVFATYSATQCLSPPKHVAAAAATPSQSRSSPNSHT